MVEVCKNLAINLFWVMAAAFELIIFSAMIIGLLSSIFKHLSDKDDKK